MRGGAAAELGQAFGRVRRVGAGLLQRGEERLGITPAGALLLLTAVLGWGLARWLGSKAAFLLVYGALLVVVAAWLLGRRTVSINATRSELAQRVVAGRPVDVGLEITAPRRVSNVIIEDLLPLALGTTVRVPITELAPRAQARHDYRFVARHRGVYNIGPLVMTRSDPFGLTRRRTVLAQPSEVIVHPSTEQVTDRIVTREWEDPPVRPPISKPWPTGFDFYGMREYAQGDDPRRIVWRATARSLDTDTGAARYFVRESEQGITDRVAIILDTDRRSHSPGEISETFETAVRTVASLGVRHLRDGFAVSLESNSSRLIDGLRGERNRIRLLDELARLQLDTTPLTRVAERMSTDRRRRSLHTVVVTADVTPEAAARLRILVDRGASLLVALVLWADSDPSSVRRAASLGCNIVEIQPGVAIEDAFRRVVGAGVRREH